MTAAQGMAAGITSRETLDKGYGGFQLCISSSFQNQAAIEGDTLTQYPLEVLHDQCSQS